MLPDLKGIPYKTLRYVCFAPVSVASTVPEYRSTSW